MTKAKETKLISNPAPTKFDGLYGKQERLAAERREAKAIEVNATTLGLTTITDDTFDICRSYYTANQTLERKAEKVGELRSTLAMHLVDEKGYDTPEHWISPNTSDSKSLLSRVEYSDCLNMFSTFLGDTYKDMLPKTLSNGIKFALGTEDVDDYGKNHPRRKLIIDAGRQPASVMKDFAKIAMELVKERKAESMTDDEKVEAEANSGHVIMTEAFNKFCKAIEKHGDEDLAKNLSKACSVITTELSKARKFEPNH